MLDLGCLVWAAAVRKDLLDVISNVDGQSKALVIDKSLISVLGNIAEFSALKVGPLLAHPRVP